MCRVVSTVDGRYSLPHPAQVGARTRGAERLQIKCLRGRGSIEVLGARIDARVEKVRSQHNRLQIGQNAKQALGHWVASY